jgi:protein-disulfide isomerase
MSLRKTFVCAFVSLFAVACQKEDPKMTEVLARLEKIDQRLEGIEKRGVGAAAARPERKRPDPTLTYNVPVDANDVVKGAKNAKVTIVEGFDYACPWCALSRPVVEEVMKKYPDSVRVVSKQFVIHPDTANLPALGVCAAKQQGKAAEFEDAVWASAWKNDGGRPKMDASQLRPDALEKLVAGLGMDAAKWKVAAESQGCKDWVSKHYRDLATVGVSSTPSFFINGRPFQGQRTVEGFSVVIDEELKKADTALASGVKLENYYAQLMAGAKKTL